ncbi:MAG: hypothetical protein GDA50_00090 [Alphaproteobacteria bacterium GM202ARS2]|nr:hypothetical protein [Alphaproteobacteria bacterium GM202ARS2]
MSVTQKKNTDKRRPTQSARSVSSPATLTSQTRRKKGGLAGDDRVPKTKAELDREIKRFMALS